MKFRTLLALGMLVILGTVSGCGSGQPIVKGTVKFSDGTPLTKGTVLFSNEQFSAAGDIKPDGTFVMGSTDVNDGVPPGRYNIAIGGDAISTYESATPLVAAKFADPKTSGITHEVKAGSSEPLAITVEKP